MLVTRAARTTIAQVQGAVAALESVSARLFGCVLNAAKGGNGDGYTYAYYGPREAEAPRHAPPSKTDKADKGGDKGEKAEARETPKRAANGKTAQRNQSSKRTNGVPIEAGTRGR